MKFTHLLTTSILLTTFVSCVLSLNAAEQRKGKRKQTDSTDITHRNNQFIQTERIMAEDLINNQTFQKKIATLREYYTEYTFIAHIKLVIDAPSISVERLQELLTLFHEKNIAIVNFSNTGTTDIRITDEDVSGFLPLVNKIRELEGFFAHCPHPIKIRLNVSNTIISSRQLQALLTIKQPIVSLDCFNCKQLTTLIPLPDSLETLNCDCCDKLKTLAIPKNLQTIECFINDLTEAMLPKQLQGTEKSAEFEQALQEGRTIKITYV